MCVLSTHIICVLVAKLFFALGPRNILYLAVCVFFFCWLVKQMMCFFLSNYGFRLGCGEYCFGALCPLNGRINHWPMTEVVLNRGRSEFITSIKSEFSVP